MSEEQMINQPTVVAHRGYTSSPIVITESLVSIHIDRQKRI